MSETVDNRGSVVSRSIISLFGIGCLATTPAYIVSAPSEINEMVQFLLTAIFFGIHFLLLITVLRNVHWANKAQIVEYISDAILVAIATWFSLWSAVLCKNLKTFDNFINFNFFLPLIIVFFVVLVWLTFAVKISISHHGVIIWIVSALMTSLLIGNSVLVIDLSGTYQFSTKTVDFPFVFSVSLLILMCIISAMSKYKKIPFSKIVLQPRSGNYNRVVLLTATIVPSFLIYLMTTPDQTSNSFSVQVSRVSLIALFTAITIRIIFAFRSVSANQQVLINASKLDELTNLANRSLILEQLSVAIEVSSATGCLPTVLIIDIDRFKNINESHGHIIGDELLIAIARRISASIADRGLVGRLFGDEFVVLDVKTKTAIESVVLADQILALLLAPFTLSHGDVFISASIGVATYRPAQTRSSADLLSNADTAKYWAKDAGRNCVAIFDELMHQRAKQRLATETALYRALERRELRLVHQPIIDIDLGDVTGFEALMRWTTQDGTVIPPTEFIPIAEDTGIIIPIGGWALLEALIHLRNWINEGICAPDATMSVNVSSRQLHDPNFIAVVNEALTRSNMPAEQLWLEVTESMMITQPDQALKTLRELSSLGVRIAIDDFGTGYSSLSFLQRFPIHRLKIDKSFVSSLAIDNSARTLVKTIIVMAQSLGLDVVAEGVETVQQLHALGDLQCSQAQGYLISHPVEPHDMAQTLIGLSKIGKWPRLRPVN